MANDNIIKFTEYSEKVNKVLSTQIGILDSAATNLEALNTAYGKLPSEYFNAIKQGLEIEKKKVEVDKELITLEQKKADLIAKTSRAEKAQIQTKQSAIRLSEQEAKATAKANQSLEQSVNTYTKIQAKIKSMIPVYNDLAAKQQIGIRLTAKEEAQLTLLTNRLTKYRGALNQVNKDYGNYSLEVGNYAQGTKNLQFSIAQISRELPNFGQSFQIGVLSLTNNLGFLLDGIKQVKAGNEILKAQGKATQSVFKTILGSFISFQTLLFIGIGLFSAYSKEIGEWAQSLFEGDKALRSTYSTLKDLGDETTQSIGRLQSLVGIVQNVTASEEERLQAIKDINAEYPTFNTNILEEKGNTEGLNLELKKYIKLLVDKAKLKANETELGEATLEAMRLEEKRGKLEKKLSDDDEIIKNDRIKRLAEIRALLSKSDLEQNERGKLIAEYDQAYQYLTFTQQRYLGVLVDELDNINKIDTLRKNSIGLIGDEEKAIKGTVDYYNELISANNKLINSGKDGKALNIESIRLLQSENEQYQKQIDLILNNTKATKENNTEIEKLQVLLKDLPSYFQKQKDSIDGVDKAIQNYTGSIEKMIGVIELPAISTDEFKAELTKLQIATDDFIGKLGFKSIEESPLSSLKTFFDGTFEDLMLGTTNFAEEFAVTFNAIGEVAKQTFATIAQLGEQNYEQELDMLQRRYESQLAFTNDSEAAKADLEEQYESRRRAIQLKQAKAQKDQALFNAGITTAQSTLAAYASQLIPGDPTSIIRAQIAAGIAAAFGLLQVGFIASQKIPEFKDGVRNFEGGNAIVGDGGVSEIVRTKNGVYATPNKDTLVNLPKGADVFKNHEEYYNSVMGEMGVLPSIPKINVVNNGLTKSDLDQVMSKHFSNIQVNKVTVDERGYRVSIEKENARTILKNNRASLKGFSV